MKILTAREFEKEPFNTLYIKFIPSMFIDQPAIKSEQRGSNSWWALDLLPWVIDDDEFKIWKENNKYELKTEDFCTDDAIYNYGNDTMYVVFDKEEVKGIINRLLTLL